MIQIVDIVDSRVAVDDPLARVVTHSGRTHVMRRVRVLRPCGIALRSRECPDPLPLQPLGKQILQTQDRGLFLFGADLPVEHERVGAQTIARVSEEHAAFGAWDLLAVVNDREMRHFPEAVTEA